MVTYSCDRSFVFTKMILNLSLQKDLNLRLLNHPDNQRDEIDDESIGCGNHSYFQTTTNDSRADISKHL